MNMEHRQYYKMVFWDGSSRVPLIVSAGNKIEMNRGIIMNHLTSSLDIFPTLLAMANVSVPANLTNVLNGYNLLPYLTKNNTNDNDVRPNYIMSQFHGDDIHLSWFMLRKDQWKYVTYGTGTEVPLRLFDMVNDPNELNDLGRNASAYAGLIAELDALLLTMVDYPSVATDVESYNKESFVLWRDAFPNKTSYMDTISGCDGMLAGNMIHLLATWPSMSGSKLQTTHLSGHFNILGGKKEGNLESFFAQIFFGWL